MDKLWKERFNHLTEKESTTTASVNGCRQKLAVISYQDAVLKEEKGSPFPTSNFPKNSRLYGRNAIRKVFFTGKKITGNIIEIRHIGCEATRFAISVPKRVGNAVARNRVKRIIREYLRHNKDNWPDNNWVIIRILRKTGKESLIIKELRDLLSQVR